MCVFKIVVVVVIIVIIIFLLFDLILTSFLYDFCFAFVFEAQYGEQALNMVAGRVYELDGHAYKVHKSLGEGGFAYVYAGKDERGRGVAIKVSRRFACRCALVFLHLCVVFVHTGSTRALCFRYRFASRTIPIFTFNTTLLHLATWILFVLLNTDTQQKKNENETENET